MKHRFRRKSDRQEKMELQLVVLGAGQRNTETTFWADDGVVGRRGWYY
ncbi:MAG TPA: hypothetical protein VEJ87_12080 [Acidimicrobiales bacterium]|nr:hypothetical protein [Acidimicrobiales bacterium]